MKYIYVMQDEQFYFKIGFSKNPLNRLKTLQQKEHKQIKLLCAWECSDVNYVERSIHSWFVDRRITGEWFNLTTNDLLFIHLYFDKDLDAKATELFTRSDTDIEAHNKVLEILTQKAKYEIVLAERYKNLARSI